MRTVQSKERARGQKNWRKRDPLGEKETPLGEKAKSDKSWRKCEFCWRKTNTCSSAAGDFGLRPMARSNRAMANGPLEPCPGAVGPGASAADAADIRVCSSRWPEGVGRRLLWQPPATSDLWPARATGPGASAATADAAAECDAAADARARQGPLELQAAGREATTDATNTGARARLSHWPNGIGRQLSPCPAGPPATVPRARWVETRARRRRPPATSDLLQAMLRSSRWPGGVGRRRSRRRQSSGQGPLEPWAAGPARARPPTKLPTPA